MRIEPGTSAFVTGGGGGIGLGVARGLAKRGARVVLADINADRLAATLAAFESEAIGVTMDITREEDWARARAEAEDRFGRIDVLANCAGIPPAIKPLLETSIEEFRLRIETNLVAIFLGMRTFGPAMVARGHGHIANVASECGLVPMARLGDYSAAKYGVVGMTEILARELADAGVGVTLVAPGVTRSNMSTAYGMDAGHVGEAIVRGIEVDTLYVLTHPSLKPGVEKRFERILSAFGESAEPGYVEPEHEWY